MYERHYEVTIHSAGYAARQAQREKKEKTKRCVCGCLAGLCFFLLLGVVGGIEHGTMALGIGTLRMFFLLAAGALFAWLAGGFDHEEV